MIVTSAITVAEVIKLDKQNPITRADSSRIISFFDKDFVRVRNVDLAIAELARNLMWDHAFLRHKDAIHVATAIKLRIPVLDTFDKELINLSEKIGDPRLRIGPPDIPYQGDLFSGIEVEQKDED